MSGNAHVRCEAGENPEIVSKDYLSLLPKIESAEMMFSASRSRRLSIVPIIQSLGQLEKNYGKEGAEIIIDNIQLTIFGGFAPNSETAQVLSKSLAAGRCRVVCQQGKGQCQPVPADDRTAPHDPDELKSMPKGQFIVMKTGTYPMKVKLKLFFKWGITFGEPYTVPDKGNRPVAYAGKQALVDAILEKYPPQVEALPNRKPWTPRPSASRWGMRPRQSGPAGERRGTMTDLKRLYQSDLPNRAIAVYLYLRGRANKEGFCWPAAPTMARELKMSESTVRRACGTWRRPDSSLWRNDFGGIRRIRPISISYPTKRAKRHSPLCKRKRRLPQHLA